MNLSFDCNSCDVLFKIIRSISMHLKFKGLSYKTYHLTHIIKCMAAAHTDSVTHHSYCLELMFRFVLSN